MGSTRRTALSCVLALALLLTTAPAPSDALGQLRSAGTATAPTGPVVAAVALAAWALALWLAVTVMLVLAARAPGLPGRVAAAVSRRVAPVAVRRAVQLALGVTVTVTGLTAPAMAAAGPGATAPAGAPASAVPSLDWPALDRPALDRPALTPSTAAPAAVPAATTPVVLAPAPVTARPSAVVVTAGDTLWSLAEAHLQRTGTAAPTDRQVAAAWPQWWSANREVVGADPDLIRPGTVLHPPTP